MTHRLRGAAQGGAPPRNLKGATRLGTEATRRVSKCTLPKAGGPLTTSAAEDMAPRKRAVDNVVVANGADSTRVGKEVALTKTCANGRGENSPRRKSAIYRCVTRATIGRTTTVGSDKL